MSASARIAALHHYPLKSARGIELEHALLTIAGFEDDRRWMLVTGAGRFLTQRELPRLALLEPRLSPTALLLTAPQRPQISIPLSRQGQRRSVIVWRDQGEAFDEVGLDVGTPVVRIHGKAIFGPVITPIPRGEAAGRLWDGVSLVTEADGFFELKRTRDRKPSFE